MIDLSTLQVQIDAMWAALVIYLPRVPAALIVLLVGWLLARFTRGLVLKIGAQIKLNEIVERVDLAEGLRQAQIKQTPTEILATFLYWLIYLNVWLIALKTLAFTAVVEPLQRFIDFLPSILIAAIIIVLGAILAKFIAQVVQATVASMGIEFHPAVGSGVRVILMVIVIIVALEQLGLDVTLLTNLMTNILTILIAALALAFAIGGRGIARSVLAGFYARDMFTLGDILEIDGEEGMLIGIGSVNSEIAMGDERMVIPNTRLTEAAVKIKQDETQIPA